MAAKALRAGDSLFAFGGEKLRIDSVYEFKTDSATAVYNLEASGEHNYYVSASEVLAHNCEKELFNFSAKALEHMSNPKRAVPVQILDMAIKHGTRVADPRGSRASMYMIEMFKNGKPYNLEVLYNETTNSIWHFKYFEIK